jgi:putative SOS response-associated peptidase YedK
MCGRFVVASSPQLLTDQFDVQENAVEIVEPNYNIAPRQQVMVVRQRDDTRVLSQLRWGLVPSWAKTAAIGDRMINARAEGLATKPAYKRAFEKHRCLIPADGFYEWQVVAPPTTPKGRPKKQPIFVHRRDGEPMAFAGLWAAWKVPEGEVVEGVGGAQASVSGRGIPARSELHDGAQASVSGRGIPARSELHDGDGWLRSCVIVTTEPNDLLALVHDRMPVVLPRSVWGRWLDPEGHDVETLAELLVPAPSDELELWPVSTLVNKADNNGPELVKPVAGVSARS